MNLILLFDISIMVAKNNTYNNCCNGNFIKTLPLEPFPFPFFVSLLTTKRALLFVAHSDNLNNPKVAAGETYLAELY
jgi:hypothetical protein